MRDSFLVNGKALRFSHVMKEHGQPEHLVIRYLCQGDQRVFTHAITVMRMILLRLHAFVKLRQDHLSDARLIRDP